MKPATACPDDDSLRKFVLGHCGEDDASAVEGHLSSCPLCLGRLDGLDAPDGPAPGLDRISTSELAARLLSGGLLEGTSIMCQCHGSRFDVGSGAVIDGPATRPLTVYTVAELDGEIQIRA